MDLEELKVVAEGHEETFRLLPIFDAYTRN